MKYHPELPVEDYTPRLPDDETAKNPFSKENIQPSTPSDAFVHILFSSDGYHSTLGKNREGDWSFTNKHTATETCWFHNPPILISEIMPLLLHMLLSSSWRH